MWKIKWFLRNRTSLSFRWYDLYVGIYWDRKKYDMYVVVLGVVLKLDFNYPGDRRLWIS